jgi:stearoyl-CoA desaturase (delta-9 desaturase)
VTWHVPHLPTREEVVAEARAMFVRTNSLDEIVDRAYALLLSSIGTRLIAATRGAT